MATPKPGEIRCPTCHRSTPPAGFCTQCGTAIPTDARIRPRGLDRDELQERIRARRSGAEPYRRGGSPDDEPAGYQRFEPEPEDLAARRSTAEGPRPDLLSEAPPPPARPDFGGGAAPSSGRRRPSPKRADLTRDRDDWTPPPAVVPMAGDPDDATPEWAARDAQSDIRAADVGDDRYQEPEHADEYQEWDDEPPRRRSQGAGALVILGFLALGVLALLGGAVLAGVFGGDPPAGSVEATPTPIASSSPEVTGTDAATPVPSTSASGGAPSQSPRASGGPIEFPDGFTAEVQPCLPGSADEDGCASNGSTNAGALDIWVGFINGNEADVISAEIIRADGSTVQTGTIQLADINCQGTCRGWTRFSVSGLATGTYEIRVTRNSDLAGEASFVVS